MNETSPAARLLGAGDVRTLAAEFGVRPTKHRGQNFVTDANTIRRIVAAADIEDTDVVLEIGPGLGSLTLGLLEAARDVHAVEVDEILAAALPRTIKKYAPVLASRLNVIEANALELTTMPDPQPTAVVANLPYNIAVPVLLTVLERFPSIEHGLVMVQLEVAERLAASPGSKVYGVPSVKAAWYASVRPAGQVGRTVFWPQPNVDSGLVAFRRQDPPDVTVGRAKVFQVIDAAFAQRRKTLRSALAVLAGSPAAAETAIRAAGVDSGLRGERLEVREFAQIAQRLFGADGLGRVS